MNITIDIDIEKFRFSLVGDGFLLDEVVEMSYERLIEIFCSRVNRHIAAEYARGARYGLYDCTR